MVDTTGIEPVTPAMSMQCSTAELRVLTEKLAAILSYENGFLQQVRLT